MSEKISRRKLLSLVASSVGISAIACIPKTLRLATVEAQSLPTDDPKIYLPGIHKDTSVVNKEGRVVHVHAVNATSWDFGDSWYGAFVDQNIVDDMINTGLLALTDQPTIQAAWNLILPEYSNGKAIAIKVNLNNAQCVDSDNRIDALIEPINAMIRGMKTIGIQENDIWVYDAIRSIPTRFKNRCEFDGVRFFDNGCTGNEMATFKSSNSNAIVFFNHPNLTTRRIADVIVNASYIINVPIIKDHGISAVTLSFKNHFGSINQIMRDGEDNLHYYINNTDTTHYSSSYNPLVDIYKNPFIKDKTRLIIGDGLFGAYGGTTNNTPPSPWKTFGNAAANSLFFSTDPVAIDCVMFDILNAEPAYHPGRIGNEDDYLRLASETGLGTYERDTPLGSGYKIIDYQRIEM